MAPQGYAPRAPRRRGPRSRKRSPRTPPRPLATEHVIDRQVTGQVIAGDPASDRAELEMLERAGMAAVLLIPVVDERGTIALVEIYRRSPQPWTGTQVDWARVLSTHVAASLARVAAVSRASA